MYKSFEELNRNFRLINNFNETKEYAKNVKDFINYFKVQLETRSLHPDEFIVNTDALFNYSTDPNNYNKNSVIGVQSSKTPLELKKMFQETLEFTEEIIDELYQKCSALTNDEIRTPQMAQKFENKNEI